MSDYSRKKAFIRYPLFTIQTLQRFWTGLASPQTSFGVRLSRIHFCGEARTGSVWLHIHRSTSIFGSEDNFQFTLKLIVESSRFHCHDTRRQASRPFELFPSQSLSSSRSSRCLCRSRKRQISQIKTSCSENHIHICRIRGPQPPLFL